MKLKFLAPALIAITFVAIFCAPSISATQNEPQRIEIVAKRYDFTPAEINLKEGVPVVLVLTSQDVAHGLKFKELGLNIKAQKGKTNEVTFTPTKAGTFIGQCSVFCGSGHGSMKLTLHVTE